MDLDVKKNLGAVSVWARPAMGYYLSAAKHIDGLILDPPGAEPGKIEDMAREVYHRHLAYLLLTHLGRTEAMLFFAGVVLVVLGALLVPMGAASLWFVGVATLAVLPAGGWLQFYLVGWTARRHADADIAQARGLVRRTFLRDVPAGTPADLADPWRHNWTTADGRPLAAELTEMDARWTLAAGMQTLRTGGVVMLLPAAWLGYGMAAFSLLALLLGVMVVAALFTKKKGMDLSNPAHIRALLLDDGASSSAESAAWVSAGGVAWGKRHDKARAAQIEVAMADKTPIITLGTASGILAGRGDPLAPSADMPVAMSLQDLCMHLFVTGGTGARKTSVLKAMVSQIARMPNVGLLVMDGKAALGYDLLPVVPDLVVIDPKNTTMCLVEGVTPAQLGEVIRERFPGASDPFWPEGAAGHLRQGATLAHRANRYSLENCFKATMDAEFRAELLEDIERNDNDLELENAVRHFEVDVPKAIEMGGGKTIEGFYQTLRTAYNTIGVGNDLLRWCQCEAGRGDHDITDVLRGGRMALIAPAARYGEAGPVVTSLIQMRIYNAIKSRADGGIPPGETPLVQVKDEFAEIALKKWDTSMATIGRSLGLAMIVACQTVEHVVAKLGEEESGALLQVLGSHIALNGRSAKTEEMISRRIGSTFRPTIQSMPGIPTTRAALMVQAAAGARAAARHQSDIGDALSWDTRGLGADLERRRGFGAIQYTQEELARQGGSEKHRANELAAVTPMCNVGAAPLVDPAEVGELVAVPGAALVAVMRGGVVRRDVVDLHTIR